MKLPAWKIRSSGGRPPKTKPFQPPKHGTQTNQPLESSFKTWSHPTKIALRFPQEKRVGLPIWVSFIRDECGGAKKVHVHSNSYIVLVRAQLQSK